MSELKTLKDIESKQFENNCEYCNGVSKEGLRQEAIKHIKELHKVSCEYNWHQIDWIKHFFNITEEDLK